MMVVRLDCGSFRRRPVLVMHVDRRVSNWVAFRLLGFPCNIVTIRPRRGKCESSRFLEATQVEVSMGVASLYASYSPVGGLLCNTDPLTRRMARLPSRL